MIEFLQFIGGGERFSKIYKGGCRIGEVGNHWFTIIYFRVTPIFKIDFLKNLFYVKIPVFS